MSDTVSVREVLPDCHWHPGVPAAVDGRTHQGPWANMCGSCFELLGVGLGLGRGQRLVTRDG